jgi:lipopolysaccharide export system protein LptA
MIKTINFTITSLLLATACSALAVGPQEQQPMSLISDAAHCERTNGSDLCIYTGNVVIKQGTGILEAPQVTIYKKYAKISKIEAIGRKAHYHVNVDDKNKVIDALANSITLYPEKNLMVLEGDGEITEDQSKFTGPYLEYVFKKPVGLD